MGSQKRARCRIVSTNPKPSLPVRYLHNYRHPRITTRTMDVSGVLQRLQAAHDDAKTLAALGAARPDSEVRGGARRRAA